MKHGKTMSVRRAGYYTVGGLLALVFLFPLAWAAWASVKGQPGTAQQGGFGLANYRQVVHFGNGLLTYFLNSTIVSAFTVAGTLFCSCLGGYAFSRFNFPAKGLLFVLTIAILMVPYATILIPLYVILGYLHLQGSLLGLALVLIMFQLPFATIMMRTSFESVPRSLDEAAEVDGCGTLSTLGRILIPGVRPGLVTVGLFAFLASWNDFVAPLILLNNGAKFTLPLAIVSLQQQSFGVINYGALEAGVVVMAIPALILFLGFQRYYVRGFMVGALRG